MRIRSDLTLQHRSSGLLVLCPVFICPPVPYKGEVILATDLRGYDQGAGQQHTNASVP